MYELPTINRFAVVLLPSEEYLKWTQTCAHPDPNLTLTDLWDDPSVYLIPEVEDLEAWLRKHYRVMFEEELSSWDTREEHWPEDRSFDAFLRFFHLIFASSVVDLGKGKIVREEM